MIGETLGNDRVAPATALAARQVGTPRYMAPGPIVLDPDGDGT
jgi:hypothetical protein